MNIDFSELNPSQNYFAISKAIIPFLKQEWFLLRNCVT
jgi:hypothetical protein